MKNYNPLSPNNNNKNKNNNNNNNNSHYRHPQAEGSKASEAQPQREHQSHESEGSSATTRSSSSESKRRSSGIATGIATGNPESEQSCCPREAAAARAETNASSSRFAMTFVLTKPQEQEMVPITSSEDEDGDESGGTKGKNGNHRSNHYNSNSNNSSNSNNNGTVLAVWMPNRSGDRRNPRCCQRLARRLPCTGSGGNRPARAGLYPYAPSNRSRWCPFLPRGSPLALASLLAILFLVAGFPSVLEAPNALADRASAGGRVPSLASGRITVPDGTGGSLSVAYYHQPSGTESTSTSDLVLLHGAAFTRENWKSSGILDLLRDGFSSVSVTALDLPVSADYRTLASVLETLGEQKIVASLPVAGLVTPSASGKAITSWIKQARKSGAGEELPLSDLPSYVRTWIPVASYSVGSCTASDLEALGGLLRSSPAAKPFGILAVYGTKDKRGKTVTETLRDRAGAKTLELTGRHPVYLDSPEEFAEAIGNEVLSRH